jgi:phosphoserine phosphatase
MNENSKKISIFDLDGTLTKSDTYLPYLVGFLKRNPKRWLKASILPFAAVMFYLKIHDNQWLKTIFLKIILGGETKKNILAWNRQNAGDIILLSTASLDIYVPDIQKWFSINHLICTNTLWRDDCLTGELDGNNCYGLEKLARVKSYSICV